MCPRSHRYYSNASVALAPIRAGGGTRIKILEAMAHGVPVVSTVLGAEGLEVTPGENILLADDASGFAECVLRLVGDAGLARAIGLGGRRFVERHHGPTAFAAAG